MNFDNKQIEDFKKVIEDIVDAQIKKHRITTYVAAIVTAVYTVDKNTVDVVIPPDISRTITGLQNKTGEALQVGDSVEICTKNGTLSNAWVAVKHGTSSSSGGVVVYNGLDSTSTTDALSANMGRVLNEKIENISVDTSWDDITGKPNFATVATSGSYNDLSNKPNLAAVATSGSYNDLSNRPSIPSKINATRLRSSTSYNTSNSTLSNAMNYDFLLLLGKASSSNSGYNTALVPTAMFSSSGLKILINDEASYVAGTFTESGNNVLFRHSGRTNTGYIQYIYGITI